MDYDNHVTGVLTAELAPSQPSGSHRPLINADAVILAGSHHWGDSPLEEVAPKPLLPVAGKPLVAHVLGSLREAGIDMTGICANSDTRRLWRSLGDGRDLGMKLEYYEDITPRGPAGCIRDAMQFTQNETIIAIEGSILPNVDFHTIVDAHRRSEACLTIGVVRDGNDRQPAGVYVLSRRALEHIKPSGYQDIKEGLVPALRAAGEIVKTFEVDLDASARVCDVMSYLAVCKWAVEALAADVSVPDHYERFGEALVHRSAQVHPDARLIGPVLVQPACVIEADAVVVGPTTVGTGTRIESGAVVSRTTLWSGCIVGKDAVVDHCLLTDRAGILAGASVRSAICIPPRNPGGRRNPAIMTDMAKDFIRQPELNSKRIVAYVASPEDEIMPKPGRFIPVGNSRVPVAAAMYRSPIALKQLK